ncbi:MAG: LytTR family transcriptional regulator, partial [Sinomicrobium sp.]|nr:LytTR family transcriptional regulator [Sinomicrobium sp.]
LGNKSKAYFHLEESRKLRNQLDQIRHNIAISKKQPELKVQIEFEEQEATLNGLTGKNSTLRKQLLILISILGIITIILFLNYYLFKRYKKKSSVLEKEKSEILQKLDELKNIVIKNHIILKDKTKIYISDLLYVKSDGHYLNIFLSNGKNHFVRGKLSRLKEELPPNFIQCHRSYIVNANFIKQINTNSIILINKERIPLSRGYKDKF